MATKNTTDAAKRRKSAKRTTAKSSTVTTLPVKHRRAPYDLIAKWAQTICRSGDDLQAKLDAFLLLMDEIEQSSRDHMRIDLIVWEAQNAAFSKSDPGDKAKDRYVEELQGKNRLRIVTKKREVA